MKEVVDYQQDKKCYKKENLNSQYEVFPLPF